MYNRTELPCTQAVEALGCPREQARIQQIPWTYRQGPTPYILPFDLTMLTHSEEPDNSRAVTTGEIFDAVCGLWDRLSLRFVPAHMEHTIFELLSSYHLFYNHRVRTQGRLASVLAYVEDAICRSLYPPGTPIGLIVSQSFSEPLTQIQLNRFHHSGEGSGLVSGVTRIKEIINCVKDIQTPSMTIVPRDGHTFDPNSIVSVTFKMVVHCWSTKRDHMVTILLNKSFMVSRVLTPRIVAEALYQDNIEYTQDLEADTWELWFPLVGDTSPLRVRDAVRVMLKSDILIHGIKRVHDFYLSTINIDRLVDGVWTVYKQPCVVTKGSNLREICKLPWVDIQYTTSNDLMEIYSVFGIDSMCTAIEENLLQVMSSNSADVSRSYLHIIAHEMCRTGVPCALTFNGLTSSKTSTLKLATFERSLESFVRAACIGHEDQLRGISESVIVGKPVSVGTGGDFELINDGHIQFGNISLPCDESEDCPLSPERPSEKRKRTDTEPLQEPTVPTRKRQKLPCVAATAVNPFLNTQNLFVPYTV
jgi:DNA-directed RNA polymerase subunit A"